MFNRVEVGGVGREEPLATLGPFENFRGPGGFVKGGIIHEDGLAGLECRHELLL